MFSSREFQWHLASATSQFGAASWTSLALLAIVSLTACTIDPAWKSADEAVVKALAAQTAANATLAACPAPTAPAPEACAASASNEVVARMLSYADRVRLILPADLGAEIARFGDNTSPASQIQMALLLAQVRQLPELIKAQEMLVRVLGSSSLEAQPLHPLARLLGARFSDQRRVEEQLDKQNQQVREIQRRLDQTNERLEALKAIERSLASRPAASAPAPAAPAASTPANRARSGAP